MAAEPTTSVRAIGMTLAALGRAGVSYEEIGRLLDVDPRTLAEPETRIPVSKLSPLWDWTSERVRDPDVGFHLALAAGRETYDVFSFIASASATLGDALERIRRYFRLLTDASDYELSQEGPHAWWSYRKLTEAPGIHRHEEEFALAVSVGYTRQWLGAEFRPSKVLFRHPAPENRGELEEFFGAPVQFESDQCAFRFDAAWLKHAVRSADLKLVEMLERYAEEALSALGTPGRYAQQVRQQIIEGLSAGETSLETVARGLAVSERSLQRHLKDEGTSHKRLLDEVRRELATRYLADRDLTASEVAYMLGFSETAPFFRAFKKWTGQTPGEYRRSSS